MVAGLDFFRKDSALYGIERAAQLVFVEPAIVKLLLVKPPMWGESSKQVRHPRAERVGAALIDEGAQQIFLSIEKVCGEDSRRTLSLQRSFQVAQEVIALQLVLKLLQLGI